MTNKQIAIIIVQDIVRSLDLREYNEQGYEIKLTPKKFVEVKKEMVKWISKLGEL